MSGNREGVLTVERWEERRDLCRLGLGCVIDRGVEQISGYLSTLRETRSFCAPRKSVAGRETTRCPAEVSFKALGAGEIIVIGIEKKRESRKGEGKGRQAACSFTILVL